MEKEFLDKKLNKECDKIYEELLDIKDGNRRIIENIKLISTLEMWAAIFRNDKGIIIQDEHQYILDMLDKLVADKTIVVGGKEYYDKDREFYLFYVDRFMYTDDKDGYIKSLVDELKCLKSYKRRVNRGGILNVKDLDRGNVLINELKKLGMSEKESKAWLDDVLDVEMDKGDDEV